MSATTPQASITSLPSLPVELLGRIGHYADLGTAIALRRTCRLTAVALRWRVLRDLNLFVTDELSPEAREAARRARIDEEEGKGRETQEVYALGRMIKGLLRRDLADPRCWEAVENVALCHRSSWMSWTISLFEEISPYIRSLRVFRGHDQSPSEDSFDNQLLCCHQQLLRGGFAISFNSLVDVTISSESLYNLQFVVFLCESAPNLCSMAFEYRACFQAHEPISKPSTAFPRSLTRDTQLKRLSLKVNCSHASRDYNPVDTIIDLLGRSPKLEVLLCKVKGGLKAEMPLEAIRTLARLRDLRWDWRLQYGAAESVDMAAGNVGFDSLRRVMLPLSEYTIPVGEMLATSMPLLEIIHLDCSRLNSSSDSRLNQGFVKRTATDQDGTYMLLPAAHASWLRKCARLRIVHYMTPMYRPVRPDQCSLFDHLDRVEAEGNVSGYIYSIKHRGDELLYGRMLIHLVHRSVSAFPDKTSVSRVLYTAAGRVLSWAKGVIQVDEPSWCAFTEYEGILVEREVIAAMKEAEGVEGSEHWNRRGVEVGADAWAVLTSWLDEKQAEISPSTPISPLSPPSSISSPASGFSSSLDD